MFLQVEITDGFKTAICQPNRSQSLTGQFECLLLVLMCASLPKECRFEGREVLARREGRRVILEVGVETSEGQSFQERRSYEKTFADRTGKTITQDLEFFSAGVRAGHIGRQ